MHASQELLAGLVATLLAGAAWGQDPMPGSVLVYPSIRQVGASTVVSVTNVNPMVPIVVRYQYLGVVPNPADPFVPNDCLVESVTELLTPSDTLTVNVRCHSPLSGLDGYLVIDAQDTMGNPISHNYLIGSQFVAQSGSATYSLAAISFQSPLQNGALTDLDLDGELDFDGLEYTQCPETLYIDTFLASLGNRLALINLTGGTPFVATIGLVVYNDNEFPLSVTRNFRCWFDRPLDSMSAIFTLAFLMNNTPHNLAEFDVDCDGVGDFETGWAEIAGIVASSPLQQIQSPALLGAVTGTTLGLERGRPLWRTGDNPNGDFINFNTVHPEFP